MAQQKIIRSRLKKVLSSSTSSLAPVPVSAKHSRRIEITLNPYFRFEWPQSPPQPQPPQYQTIFNNQSAYSNVGVHRCSQHYPYAKDQLFTRSLTDLRVSTPLSNGKMVITPFKHFREHFASSFQLNLKL
jgi:hypothetical protein